jgi:hypothetical protein
LHAGTKNRCLTTWLYSIRLLDGRTNGERGKGEAGLEERAVQERGDIASKQQVIPSRTDYNKLATLIETDGKLSALFACKAFTYLGERFCNLRLVTLNAHLLKDSLAPRPPKVGNLRQHLVLSR